jgi:hypothetical protein
MGRGAVGGGGLVPDGRPDGNGGGEPPSFSMGRSGLSSGLRGGIRDGDRGCGGVEIDASAVTVDPGAGWIEGAGRGASGGGAGTFVGPTSALTPGAPPSRTSSFSSDFRSSSEDNGMDCDQSDIPTHEKYKVAAQHSRITFGLLENIKRFILYLRCQEASLIT